MTTATLPRQTIDRLVLAAVCTAVLVMIVGWFTDVRQLLHWILLTLAVTAFLPFVIIGGGLAIGLVLALLGAVLAADASAGAAIGEGATEIGVRILHPYYRFLGRRRHPLFWGIPVGMLLGCLLLGGIIALVIVPSETRTIRILAETQQQIEKFHKKTGRFPAPDAEGKLTFKALDMQPPEAANDRYVRDGFGRPLYFRVKGKGILASYTLTSWGYDGKPSKDDLCISGSSQVAKWAEQAVKLAAKFGPDKEGNAAPLTVRLRGILDLQCPYEGEH